MCVYALLLGRDRSVVTASFDGVLEEFVTCDNISTPRSSSAPPFLVQSQEATAPMDNNNDNEIWEWEKEDCCFQKHTDLEISQSLWDGDYLMCQNEDDLSYMFEETTPIKDCGDMFYHSIDENMDKESEPYAETPSLVKRRRMLQFDSQDSDASFCNEEMPSAFLKSKGKDDSVEEALSDLPQWVSGSAEDTSVSGYESLYQSSEAWLTDCFNDAVIHFSSDDMNSSSASNVHIDMTGLCDARPEYEASMVQEHPTLTRSNVIFKGRKSYMRTPTKLASSVAYPFAFIKPNGAHGDLTLKDINQRIRTPPPMKSKQSKEHPSAPYPTSAFTGKPVVGKTKIRTDGGKGSITITRTKG